MTKQPEVGALVRRALVPEMRGVDESKRTITFTASDESVDRYGDILRVSGWKFSNYLRNPVVLWAHKSGDPPVGKCVEIHTESNPPALVQTVEFADHPFAETVRKLYADKFLRAVSVGFMPLEPPKRITDLEGNGTGGYEFTSMDLLELSCVPVPANPEALARCVEKGFAEADLARVFSPMSAVDVYKELSEVSLALAQLTTSLARVTVREALAALKAAGVRSESSGDLTLEEMLSVVKQAGTAVQEAPEPEIETGEIDSIEKLGAALGGDGIEQFERSLGIRWP